MSSKFKKYVLLLLEDRAYKNKGVIPAFVIYGAAIALLIVAGFFIALFSFYGSTEITISDKIADGLSSINYFYLTEKNINEFIQMVTEITAKELGEKCGGFDCYSWKADSPSYKDLRDKFDSELRGKITGFPENIGNGGRISFEPPEITGLEMDESHVKISILPQQVYRKTNSFIVNATSDKQTEIEKQIRYLLLAKIGQKLYTNGTYVRDWGKIFVNWGRFDCNSDGKADKTISARTGLASAGANGCRILGISFDVEGSDWNSFKANCRNIANSADPGASAGKVEGSKIYVQIDNLIEKSIICGIDGTDGLASITDTKGEVSKSSSSSQPSCDEKEAGANAWQKADMPGRMQTILNSLSSAMEAGQAQIDVQTSVMIGSANSYSPSDSQAGWTIGCGNRGFDSCGGGCGSTQQYCKTGDGCAQQSSFSCKVTGTCSYSPCTSRSCSSYRTENNAGYCCPKDYPVFDSYMKTCFASSGENLKIEVLNRVPPPGGKTACDDCSSWRYSNYGSSTGSPSCSWSNSNSGTFCGWRSSYSCAYSGNQNSGSTSTSADYWWSGASACGNQHNTMSRQQSWGNGIFSQARNDYWRSWQYDYSSSSSTYSCYLTAYYKFTFVPDITFKIVDNSIRIVKKGTTDFEDLYFQVKFKPSTPYVIGDLAAPALPEYTCAKTLDQTCETGSCPSGKTIGTGTCESGKVCCTPQANTCAALGGTCVSGSSCPADSPVEIEKAIISDCAETGKKCCAKKKDETTADVFVVLKFSDAYGQPTATKSLKLSCKNEVLGTVQSTDVEAGYETINLGGGLHLVKFKFTKEKLQQLKDAGCTW